MLDFGVYLGVEIARDKNKDIALVEINPPLTVYRRGKRSSLFYSAPKILAYTLRIETNMSLLRAGDLP